MTDAGQSGRQGPGGLVTFSGDVRQSGYVSPSGSNQRIIWRFHTCPDVYLGIDTELESSKQFKFPGQLEQECSLSSCFSLHNVNSFSSLVKGSPFCIFSIFTLLSLSLSGFSTKRNYGETLPAVCLFVCLFLLSL